MPFVTNAPHLDNALGHLHIDAARGPLDAKGGADRPDTHIANLDNEGPRAILGDLKQRFTVVERDLADLRLHRHDKPGLRVYRCQRTIAKRDPPDSPHTRMDLRLARSEILLTRAA